MHSRSCGRFQATVRHLWLFLPMLLGFAAPAAAEPDLRLLEAARREQPALIASLQDMVQIESPSSDAAGLVRMADYTERRLRQLGASVERRKGTQGPGDIVIGTFHGTGTKRLMLIAHMDTVYPVGTLKTQPYRIDGNRIYGPGIADDKGGISVALHALKIMKDMKLQDYARLTVLFNADEETGSRGSGMLIAALAGEHDIVLSCEPTPDVPEGVLLSAAGTATVTMQVQGRASHAGAAPQRGRNALVELSHQILQTEDIARSVPGTQLNWTIAGAGIVRNQIPEQAHAMADMRLTAPDGIERMQAALQERVKQRRVPDTETTIRIERGRPPYVATPAAQELARKAEAIYAEIDRKLTLIPATGGATDAGFANLTGRAAVLESLGLAGAGYHARDEYIVIDSIVPRLYLLIRLLQEAAR
ncbi:M20/M25/M40 family metallo-hydrolase [Noviherbaspirillum sp. CPCC 100848]|uniref:M20/M25/M40 family metallo-hydrolase n=1 Tax=Noviherbaspirillum album TaxID=3080276 RepID=A0ABU6JFM5_9BURK|nr:M20/M25/M40 family metallo-hydrolase [Noviherbaspirillum sp. CPCC 100848]MEC4722476.1 M20/M25/M40 family metallo-hydrolase [Noviherbaspirillum sp. CPCC 100848]